MHTIYPIELPRTPGDPCLEIRKGSTTQDEDYPYRTRCLSPNGEPLYVDRDTYDRLYGEQPFQAITLPAGEYDRQVVKNVLNLICDLHGEEITEAEGAALAHIFTDFVWSAEKSDK